MIATKSQTARRIAEFLALTGTLLLMASASASLVLIAERSTAPNVITIESFAFAPERLTVTAGTTVTWINRDETPHTVVSNDKTIRSAGLDTGNRFQYRFTTPGTFFYHCSLHPQMTGTIIVQ